MKKNVFGLAAMAVAVSMASCSLEEVMEQPAQQAIGFSTFVGKSTKAEIVGVGSPGGLTEFYVFGKYGDATGTYTTDVFTNDKVEVTAANTAIETTEYWVADKHYKFAAYSDGNSQLPTPANVSFDNDGHITFCDYKAGTNDLILAAPTNEVTTPATITSDNPSAVTLEFKHLLSQVAFEFKNGFTNGYKVKITDLQFNVNNKATYSYQTDDYTWGTPTELTYKSYTINSNAAFAASDGDKTSEFNFVIPQTNADIKASFTVTVYDTDGTTQIAEKKYADDNAVSLATGTTTTPGSDSNTWTPGYKYKYTATINADVLDDVMFPIKFTVSSVEGWTDAKNGSNEDFGLTLN